MSSSAPVIPYTSVAPFNIANEFLNICEGRRGHKEEGFIDRYEVAKGKPQPMIKIHLKYTDEQPGILGLVRVSKPGLRGYGEGQEVPRVYGGLGIAILSTSKGIMTGQEAWKRHLGGEILCYVW